MAKKNSEKLLAYCRIYSLINASLEYYLLFDIYREGTNRYIDMSLPECALINESARRLISGEGLSELVPEYEKMRKQIIEKMQVATAYVDKISAYSHVMERIRARFSMSEEERNKWLSDFDRDLYAEDIMEYIISNKDSGAVGLEIQEIMEQLPIRVARSKFIDMVRKSIGFYKNSDKESLDSFIYMLRTVSMLYEPEGMDRYFTEFADFIEELEAADFANMDKDCYDLLFGKLADKASELMNITDAYCAYQKIINMLYSYALTEDLDDGGGDGRMKRAVKACKALIALVYDALAGNTEDAYGAEEALARIEGIPEDMYDENMSAARDWDKCEAEGGIPEKYAIIRSLIFSDSIFAEHESGESEPVTDEYINKVTEELVSDIMDMLKARNRQMSRSIMAIILGQLPPFFNNLDEMLAYIKNSLNSCNDTAELIATVENIDDIMGIEHD